MHLAMVLGFHDPTLVCGLDGQLLDLPSTVKSVDPTLQSCLPVTGDLLGLPLPLVNLMISISIAGLLMGALVRRVSKGLPLITH